MPPHLEGAEDGHEDGLGPFLDAIGVAVLADQDSGTYYPLPGVPECRLTSADKSHPSGAMPASTRLPSRGNGGGSCRHPESAR